MNIDDLNLSIIEEDNYRDYTAPANLAKDINIKEFSNKVRLEDILNYIPRKMYLTGKVYTLALVVGTEFCTINYYSNIDEELKSAHFSKEEEILDPANPWKFYHEHLAYILLHICKMLVQIGAVEIDENLKFVGNKKMVIGYDTLSEFMQEEIKDYAVK